MNNKSMSWSQESFVVLSYVFIIIQILRILKVIWIFETSKKKKGIIKPITLHLI